MLTAGSSTRTGPFEDDSAKLSTDWDDKKKYRYDNGEADAYESPPVYSRVEKPRRRRAENLLELLEKYDTLILVDDSASMKDPAQSSHHGHGRGSGITRWEQAQTALEQIAKNVAPYDKDGIDICFLNNKQKGEGLKSAEQVMRLFNSVKPSGTTPTAARLEEILKEYIVKAVKSHRPRSLRKWMSLFKPISPVKPLNILVITDGEANEYPAPVIIKAAKQLDGAHLALDQVGIQFVQIGDDPKATKALKKLDDDLKGENSVRDMVDTFPFGTMGGEVTPEALEKILLGGVNRNQDEREA